MGKKEKKEVACRDRLESMFTGVSEVDNIKSIDVTQRPAARPSMWTHTRAWNSSTGIREEARKAGILTPAESARLAAALDVLPWLEQKPQHAVFQIVHTLFLINAQMIKQNKELKDFRRQNFDHYDFLQPTPRTTKRSVWKEVKRHNRSTHGKGAFAL